MVHTSKKRVHFRISREALARLDELVSVANRSTARHCVITRSDILEQIIIKNTRNKLEVVDQQIREHAKEINRLQQVKTDLEKERETMGI